MKKADRSEDLTLEAAAEESSTSLAPAMLFLTSVDAVTPSTEESRILPVTSPWPQVGAPCGHESERASPVTAWQGSLEEQN